MNVFPELVGAMTGQGILLVGDAASFIDPLSSYGVKKACVSAWLAAVVVHTCLTNASLTSAALRAPERPETLQTARYCGTATLWLLSEHR